MCFGITARLCHTTYNSTKRHMRTHAALGPWTVPCAMTSLWGFATRHTIVTKTTSDSRQGPQKRPILNSCCCTKHRTGHRSGNTKEYLLSQLFFPFLLPNYTWAPWIWRSSLCWRPPQHQHPPWAYAHHWLKSRQTVLKHFQVGLDPGFWSNGLTLLI